MQSDLIDPTNPVVAFLASLYLNLGDAQANVGEVVATAESVRRAAAHLDLVAQGGYRALLTLGIRRLAAKVGVARDVEAAITSRLTEEAAHSFACRQHTQELQAAPVN